MIAAWWALFQMNSVIKFHLSSSVALPIVSCLRQVYSSFNVIALYSTLVVNLWDWLKHETMRQWDHETVRPWDSETMSSWQSRYGVQPVATTAMAPTKISVALSPIANCTNWATANCWRTAMTIYILSRIPGVTNNSTWVRIGYRIYLLWRFTAATQITITMSTIALSASHFDDSLGALTDED
jgi:hypothetical protein